MNQSFRLHGLIALIVFAFGFFAMDLQSPFLLVLSLGLYSVPLLAWLCPCTPVVRTWSLWIGFFLVAQCLISPLVLRRVKTLPPSLAITIDTDSDFNGVGQIQSFSTDPKGYRSNGTIDYGDPKPLRVFAIGPSVTEQLLLGNDKTWTHLAEASLKTRLSDQIEVINAGRSGARAMNVYHMMLDTQKFSPDVYVIMLGANDWMHQIRRAFDKDPMSYADDILTEYGLPDFLQFLWFSKTMLGQLCATLSDRVKGIQSWEQEARHKKYFRLRDYFAVQNRSLERPSRYRFVPTEVTPSFSRYLEKIMDLCRKGAFKCIFTSHPNGYKSGISDEYKQTFFMTPMDRDYTLEFESMVHIASIYNAQIKSLAAAYQQRYCPLDESLAPGFDSYFDDMHVNESGARRAAEIVSDCIYKVANNRAP